MNIIPDECTPLYKKTIRTHELSACRIKAQTFCDKNGPITTGLEISSPGSSTFRYSKLEIIPSGLQVTLDQKTMKLDTLNLIKPGNPTASEGVVGAKMFNTVTGETSVKDATNGWEVVSVMDKPCLLGSIISSVLSESHMSLVSQNYVLADGRSIVGTPLHELTNMTHSPDLRGVFLRAANSSTDALQHFGDMTALPKTLFYVTSATTPVGSSVAINNVDGYESGYAQQQKTQHVTSTNPPPFSHTHIISGGDPETRPVNFTTYLYLCIG